MQETTLPKPLSGHELIDAICYDIKQALLRDSHFGSHIAYPCYAFTGNLTVRTPRGVTQEFSRPVEGASYGATPLLAAAADDGEMAMVEVAASRDATVPEMPPNQVRYETDQPIPVLLTDPETGRTRETVKSYRGRTVTGKPKAPSAPKSRDVPSILTGDAIATVGKA